MGEDVRSPHQLTTDMRRLGVHPGDLLMVHASLRRIGPVAGGAAGVVEALDAAVNPGGTLLMVLGARDDHAWVNERPESEREALLSDAEPFDYLRTSALPEVGVLAEVLRTAPGTVVNDHPEGRFAARGRLAHELLHDTPWDDYYGPDSPLQRFIRAGGRVLRLGADQDTTTVLHFAEYLADVAEKVRVRRYRKIAGTAGTRIVVVESLDDENGVVPAERQPKQDYFALILRAYIESRQVPQGMVGSARAELIDAADLVAFGARWVTTNLR